MPARGREIVATATPPVTPATLSDHISQADLGPLDRQTALIVKLCEAQTEKRFEKVIADLESRLSGLSAQYDSTLRELRDKLDAVRVDDFVKVGFGLLAGIVIRRMAEVGVNALSEFAILYSLVGLAVSFTFLVARWTRPSTRRREIQAEIKRRQKDNG